MCVGLVYIILKACPLHKAGRWMPPNQGDTQGRNQVGAGRFRNAPFSISTAPPSPPDKKDVSLEVKPILVKFYSLSYVKTFGMERRGRKYLVMKFWRFALPLNTQPRAGRYRSNQKITFFKLFYTNNRILQENTGENIENR